MIATKFGTLLISLFLPQSLAPCGSKVYKNFFQHRLKPLSAKPDGMADISAAQSAESATESGETARTIQALEEKWENRFDQLSAMIKILADGSAAKASKRRAHVCDSSSDDEPPKKSKKAVGTAPAPQTLTGRRRN